MSASESSERSVERISANVAAAVARISSRLHVDPPASRPAAHDRFWSDRLVYTSSTGKRFGKADIMAGLESGGDEETAVYTAEDIQVQQFGNAAVVAFRLVSSPLEAEGSRIEYFNTGTFVNLQDQWKVVAWQATRIPAD